MCVSLSKPEFKFRCSINELFGFSSLLHYSALILFAVVEVFVFCSLLNSISNCLFIYLFSLILQNEFSIGVCIVMFQLALRYPKTDSLLQIINVSIFQLYFLFVYDFFLPFFVPCNYKVLIFLKRIFIKLIKFENYNTQSLIKTTTRFYLIN